MDLQQRLDVLINLARDAGIEIRRESLGGDTGGLCTLKGRRILFIDTLADLETQYERTLSAMAALPEIDQRFLPPQLREDVDRYRGGG